MDISDLLRHIECILSHTNGGRFVELGDAVGETEEAGSEIGNWVSRLTILFVKEFTKAGILVPYLLLS